MNRLIANLLHRPTRSNGNGNGVAPSGPSGTHTLSRRARYVVTRAESAPCTCPDPCERDHEND
jgi:hypothetical protein